MSNFLGLDEETLNNLRRTVHVDESLGEKVNDVMMRPIRENREQIQREIDSLRVQVETLEAQKQGNWLGIVSIVLATCALFVAVIALLYKC